MGMDIVWEEIKKFEKERVGVKKTPVSFDS